MLRTRDCTMQGSRMAWGLALLAVSLLGVLLTSSLAAAQCIPLSKGDVEGFLRAFNTGGLAIRANAPGQGVLDGAPSGTGPAGGVIRGNPFFDGRHYCVDDWHVALVSTYDADFKPFTLNQARADFEKITVELYLDGVLLTTTRTPVTAAIFNDNASGEIAVYAINEGTLFAPGAIGVGAHTFRDRVSFEGVPFSDRTITFYVDPSGSPSCCH